MPPKIHTTNYFDAFIGIAEDCPTVSGEIPPRAETPSIASLQFEFLHDRPYIHTSDDVLFGTFAKKNGIPKKDLAKQRAAFFSKGQPCFRASPLTKRYGWGIHADSQGKIAMYPMGSPEYAKFSKDKKLKQLKAMRSKRA
jgi:hypothetical protein